MSDLRAGTVWLRRDWTYLTTDEPFGPITERFMRGLRRMLRSKG